MSQNSIHQLQEAAKIALVCGYSYSEWLEMARQAIADVALERFKNKSKAAIELCTRRDTIYYAHVRRKGHKKPPVGLPKDFARRFYGRRKPVASSKT